MKNTKQDELVIDGRMGEGGGQVFRTSLSLAAALGRAVTIHDIRGGRPKPGLLRQHRAALRAVRDITGGQVEGDELGSRLVRFVPGGPPQGGKYHFGVGSAGSTMLVLQTALPPLLLADAPSVLTLEGGTHNPMAPPFEMFNESFLPQLRAMGLRIDATLERHGFFPAGGGQLRVDVQPAAKTVALELLERGAPQAPSCEVLLQNLSSDVAEREIKPVKKRMRWPADQFEVTEVRGGSGPGNVMLGRLPFANVTSVHTAFGMRARAGDRVGAELAADLRGYLSTDAPVCEHLADQLMLPMALFEGGRYRCSHVSEHTLTNAEVINLFLPGAVEIMPEEALATDDRDPRRAGLCPATVRAAGR